jgi:hypothetical protein
MYSTLPDCAAWIVHAAIFMSCIRPKAYRDLHPLYDLISIRSKYNKAMNHNESNQVRGCCDMFKKAIKSVVKSDAKRKSDTIRLEQYRQLYIMRINGR